MILTLNTANESFHWTLWFLNTPGEADAHNWLFMKEYDFLSLHFFPLSDLLCLRSSRSKYNASTINCLLVFSTLQPKINTLVYDNLPSEISLVSKESSYIFTFWEPKWASSANTQIILSLNNLHQSTRGSNMQNWGFAGQLADLLKVVLEEVLNTLAMTDCQQRWRQGIWTLYGRWGFLSKL